MKRLSDIPLSRPAATPHSPNRKDRRLSQMKMASVEARKKVYLDCILAGETEQQAEERIGADRAQIYRWEKSDPDFRQRCEEALEFDRRLGQRQSGPLISKSVNVVSDTLDGKKITPQQYKAANDTLRGMRVWDAWERVAVAVGVQVNEPPKIVEVVRPDDNPHD